MTINYKVLGQSNPSATTATNLYTVPALTSAIISTISICNQGVSGTFRIAIRPAGATLSALHYIAYDASLNANDSISLSLGVTLATTDIITIYASTANFSFSAFGSEIT
jgi:hypothetical protein